MGKKGKNLTITVSDVGFAAAGSVTSLFTNWLVNKVVDNYVPVDYQPTAKRAAMGTKVIGGAAATYKIKDRRGKMFALGFTAASTLEASVEAVKVFAPEQSGTFALISGVEDIYTHIGDPSTDTVTLNIEPGAADMGMFKETAILGTQEGALSVL